MPTSRGTLRRAPHSRSSRGLGPGVFRPAEGSSFRRRTHIRGDVCFSPGRKEVRQYHERCGAVGDSEGLHIVTQPDGAIVTVYKNRQSRVLRPRRAPQWGPAAGTPQ